MKKLAVAALLFALGMQPVAAAAAAADSDPAAVKVAEQVLASLGGARRWDGLRGLRWSFGSASGDTVRFTRVHAWDKWTGQHRVEGTTRSGQKFVFIHTLGDSTQGMAWYDGVAVAPDSARKLAKRANAMWVNDSYWFLMPYKMLDPGVHLKDEGETRFEGVRYRKVGMTFGAVGLTPGDHYWVFVNPRTHRVERWEMVLQGEAPPPVGYSWEGWEQHDGLWFPTAHRQGRVNQFTNAIETVREFPPGTFTGP